MLILINRNQKVRPYGEINLLRSFFPVGCERPKKKGGIMRFIKAILNRIRKWL